MSGLFEHLAATDDSAYIAHRKASAVALKRVRDQFGAFLANAKGDLPARLALIEDDLAQVVVDVVAEHGGDVQKIHAAIKQSIVPPMGGGGGMPVPGQGAPGATQPTGSETCPQCGGPMLNGQCPTCSGGAYGGAASAPNGAYGLTHTMPQGQSTGPVLAKGAFCDVCHGWKSGPGKSCVCDGSSKDSDEPGDSEAKEDQDHESSVRTARRPKMCPYHSEVVDISLGAGNPQAGYQAMTTHAWGDRHCKGGYEGTCNFRPAMVTQQYWSDKANEYAERAKQRELERSLPSEISEDSLSIDTEPIMHAEPLPNEPGKEGVSDIDGELANAPSAVGGDLAMAASTKKGEALKTVKLPTGDETALGGPSPKIDKSPSGDQAGWSLEDIDTQMDGSPNPTSDQDPTDRADYNKTEFLDQTKAVTESVELDSAPDLMDDAGFAPGGEEHGPHTDTWSGKGGQANPVTRDALSHQRRSINIADMPMMQPGWSSGTPTQPTGSQPTGSQPTVGNPQTGMQMSPEYLAQLQAENEQWRQNHGISVGGPSIQDFWSKPGQQPASPTNPALSAVDPDKNPIREIMESYEGFLMPNEVQSALGDLGIG